MKKIFIYIIIFIIVLAVIWVFLFKNKDTEAPQDISTPEVVEVVLDDKVIVEKYIRENIKNIVTEEPVLGGSWYLASIDIDTSTKTGTMIYEDGHIQGKANFNYIRSGEQVTINLTF